MQLRTLRLRNLRSYEKAELAFGPGTTLLVGDVGSGKTSLLYAVEMALFGFAEVDPVHLIRHHAREAEVALALEGDGHRVELRRKFARRSRKGRDSFEAEACSFSEDGATRTYSPTELRQRAIDLLGFPDNPNPRAHSDLWRWAVYVPQERMRDVLAQSPDERRETVRKALGLERYKAASDNAALLAREIHGKARALGERARHLAVHDEALARASAERDSGRRKLDALREGRALSEGALAEAEAGRALAEDRLRQEEVERAELLGIEDDLKTLELRSRTLRLRHEELETRLGELEQEAIEATALAGTLGERSADRARVARNLSDARAARDAEEAYRRRATDLDAERRSRSRALELAERSAADYRVEAEARRRAWEASPAIVRPTLPAQLEGQDRVGLSARLAERRAACEPLRAELARQLLVAEDLEALRDSGECPRCHQKVDAPSFEAHRLEAIHAAEGAGAALRGAEATRAEAEFDLGAYEAFERALAESASAEQRRRSAEEILNVAVERVARAETEVEQGRSALEESDASRRAHVRSLPEPAPGALEEAEGAWAKAEEAYSAARRAEDRRQDLTERLEELRAERSARSAEVAEVAEALGRRRPRREELAVRLAGTSATVERDAAERRYREARLRADGLGRELARTEAELLAHLRRVEEAEAGIVQRQGLERAAQDETRLAEFLSGSFREEIDGLEQRLLGRAVTEFGRTFSRCFQTLVEDPQLSARTDGAFTPAVEIDGEWTPAEALSGGERTALALAFRLALGRVVRLAGRLSLETLILDEPTDGFSAEQVLRLGDLLNELEIPQVVLVSHEPGLAAIADVVVRVAKVDGVSVLLADSPTEAGRQAATPPAAAGPAPSEMEPPPA